MILSLALAWVLILVGIWLGWQLLRQNGRLILRLEAIEERLNIIEFGDASAPVGLPVGSVAPEFDLPDLAGERRTLAQFRAQPLLLIFFNTDCGYCRDMAPKLAGLKQRSGGRGQKSDAASNGTPLPVIISGGDAEKNRQFFNEHKITSPVLLQNDSEVAKVYEANGTPTGYLVDAEGKIASALAVGAEAVLALASGDSQPALSPQPTDDRASRFGNRSLARSKLARNGLKAGTPAPLFRLPRLGGGELALEDLRGSRVLLVFSDPHCGPCELLAPQLERWHRDHPDIRVVMISRGDPEENHAKVKEHGLTFPAVLQQQWEISRRYAMFATPIAYLIDQAGVIVHEVAVGEDEIRKLLIEAAEPQHQGDITAWPR